MARIFVVEDNEGLRGTISSYLRLDEHDVVEFARLDGLDEAIRMQQPDLVILDVMLPDGDAFPFARRLRAGSHVPIIFLTARTSESDRITGFEVGGDDYVVKPFSNKELMLRVRALLRRSADGGGDAPAIGRWSLESGGTVSRLELHHEAHLCLHDGREVVLTAAEWKILSYLAEHARVVISRERLLGVCLDYFAEGSERTIDTHIKNIRIKLGRQQWIDTVRGYGYRFAGRETQNELRPPAAAPTERTGSGARLATGAGRPPGSERTA